MGRLVASEVVDGKPSFCGDDALYMFLGTSCSFFLVILEPCSGMSGGSFWWNFRLAPSSHTAAPRSFSRRGLPAADGSAFAPKSPRWGTREAYNTHIACFVLVECVCIGMA